MMGFFGQRVVRVPISCDLTVKMLTQGSGSLDDRFISVKEGLPPGSKCVGILECLPKGTFYLYVEHESFAVVEDVVPEKEVILETHMRQGATS